MHAPPRHHTPRSDLPTRGGQVAAIAAAKGKPLLPWQRDFVDVALEYDPDTGLYRYGIIVLTVPRQSGKTTVVGSMADHRCISRPGARVWLTMQSGKMADSWMRNEHLPSLLPLGDPERKGAAYKPSLRAGEVGVIWRGLNSTFFTFPPKRDALHSKQSDFTVISEAWALSLEQGTDVRQAVRPTMATRRGAQLLVESTLGDDSSVFLDDYVQMGIESLTLDGTRVCIADYGIADDDDPEDLELLASKHPGYTGGLVPLQSLVDAREEFGTDVAGWARAYGNRATRTRETAIPAVVWAAAARPRPDVPARAGIGVDATPSGSHVAISAAWRDDQGEAFVEVIHAGPTDRDTPALLAKIAKANGGTLTVDRAALGALELLDAVARRHPSIEVRYLTMGEYASACGTFLRGVYDEQLHHFHQPELTAAVEVAAKRDLGDGGFGWRRRDSAGRIEALVSATVALKAFDTLPKAGPRPRLVIASR